MKIIKIILKVIIAAPLIYVLVALLLMLVPINRQIEGVERNNTIWIVSNGVHLSLILHVNDLDTTLKEGLVEDSDDRYYLFGWGDKNFMLNTPTWADLTIKYATTALFVRGPTSIHVMRYKEYRDHWTEIKVSEDQLKMLNQYIKNTFMQDSPGSMVLIRSKVYSDNDSFYEARGNFTCFRTCNAWVNAGLRESGIKSLLWTPFDFGLLTIHDN